jgi:hypothetical protein
LNAILRKLVSPSPFLSLSLSSSHMQCVPNGVFV